MIGSILCSDSGWKGVGEAAGGGGGHNFPVFLFAPSSTREPVHRLDRKEKHMTSPIANWSITTNHKLPVREEMNDQIKLWNHSPLGISQGMFDIV